MFYFGMITLILSGIATALTSNYINYYTDSTNFQPNSQNRESIAECQFPGQEVTSSSSIVRSIAAILFYFTCVTKAVARSQSISTEIPIYFRWVPTLLLSSYLFIYLIFYNNNSFDNILGSATL